MSLMPNISMTLDASVLRRIRLGQRRRMGDSCRRSARLVEQRIVAMQASLVGQSILYSGAHLLRVIAANAVMFVNIFGALISFVGKMGKISIFWREMAIDALNANAIAVRAVRRKFPGPIGGIHLMARAAAILGFRYRHHSCIECNKAQYSKDKSGYKCSCPFFERSDDPTNHFTPKSKHAQNVSLHSSRARTFTGADNRIS